MSSCPVEDVEFKPCDSPEARIVHSTPKFARNISMIAALGLLLRYLLSLWTEALLLSCLVVCLSGYWNFRKACFLSWKLKAKPGARASSQVKQRATNVSLTRKRLARYSKAEKDDGQHLVRHERKRRLHLTSG